MKVQKSAALSPFIQSEDLIAAGRLVPKHSVVGGEKTAAEIAATLPSFSRSHITFDLAASKTTFVKPRFPINANVETFQRRDG